MKLSKRSYPHPVLSYFTDDILNSAFQSIVDITPDKTGFNFEVRMQLSNKDIMKLIKDGLAVYALHIECRSTRHRQLLSFSENNRDFFIKKDNLSGRVELCPFILAAKDIGHYVNKDFHPDYEGMSFPIKKGDVLAAAEDEFFIVESQWDSLKKNASIFSIVKTDIPPNTPFTLDLTSQKAIIKLPSGLYEKYKELRHGQESNEILINLLILPSLVYMVEMLLKREYDDSYYDKRWFQKIGETLKHLKIDIGTTSDSSLEIAQKLLEFPLMRSLGHLEGFAMETNGDEGK